MQRRFVLLLPSIAALQLGSRGLWMPAVSSARARPVASTPAAEAELLSILAASGQEDRGKALSAQDLANVHRLAIELESGAAADQDTNGSPLLPGRWRVLYQGKPGTTTSFFSVESWRSYLSGDGPSPIQNLVSGSSTVSRLYQVVEIEEVDGKAEGRVNNVVDFSPSGVIAIEAALEDRPQPSRLGFRFTGGRVLLRTLWNGTLSFPYPVPFELLGDNAKGWLDTQYLSPQLRLTRGNKGSLFVLTPEAEPDDPELEALLSPPPPAAPAAPVAATLAPVLVCPAQFGTDADYAELVDGLRARGHPVLVTPLKFTDWLRLIPASLTAEYWRGELSPEVALPFYFEALDAATAQLQSEHGPDAQIQLVGHSIGGWIARAYLGQLTPERRAAYSALVTLGTPHSPPPEGPLRTLDQTRGLLTNVESNFPGAFHPELRYLTVGSTAVKGALTPELGPLLATAAYLPLCGDAFAEGDGITPISCVHLDGAEQRELEAFHISFVPGIGTRLLGTPWYGSPALLDGWADFLR